MAADIDALTAPFSAETPAGPDLSYEASRQLIEAAFERSVSDDGGEDGDVDWRKTIDQVLQQASETRDIWLAIYLIRAGAKAGQLDTVEDGAELLAGLFETLWDSVHPDLEEYGFQGRKGPCESLTKLPDFLTPFRKIALLQHPRFGNFSGADFERFRENGEAEDGYGMFRALLEETSDDDLSAIAAQIVKIGDSIRRADAVLVANADGDTGTNFTPTYEVLYNINRSILACLRAPKDEADESAPDEAYEAAESGEEGRTFGGRIGSREDVVRALDAIAEYYAQKEPASPVPFVLRRAREWVSLDFLSILEDIAPNSLDEAVRVLKNGRNGGGSDGWSSGENDEGSS